jgi:hypothetical protein
MQNNANKAAATADGGDGGDMDFGEPTTLSNDQLNSRWLCRKCADECGVTTGKPCSVCNAPWMDRSSFLGSNSRHSRECMTCGKSFCATCKKTNMIREKTTEAIRQSFSGKSTFGKPQTGVFASFSSRLSFSVNGEDANENSARAPLHKYECLACRAEHKYRPVRKTEVSESHVIDQNNQNNKSTNKQKLMANHPSLKNNNTSLKQTKPSRRASAPVKRSTSPVPYPPVSGNSITEKSWFKKVLIEVHAKEKLGIDMDKDLVISRVFPNSAASRAGLEVGWAILDIDGIHVVNHPQAQRAIIGAFEKGEGTSFFISVSTAGR